MQKDLALRSEKYLSAKSGRKEKVFTLGTGSSNSSSITFERDTWAPHISIRARLPTCLQSEHTGCHQQTHNRETNRFFSQGERADFDSEIVPTHPSSTRQVREEETNYRELMVAFVSFLLNPFITLHFPSTHSSPQCAIYLSPRAVLLP